MEYIGWVGSILFAACGLPQAVQSYRLGNSDGLAWSFLLMWFFGELFTLIYIIPKADYPLIFNYIVNMVFLLVIIKFKIWKRK